MEKQYQIRLTNLNWLAKESDIQDFVTTFAKVKEVKLLFDKNKKSKGLMKLLLGMAYVTLEDEEGLKNALNGVPRSHMEREIRIIKAKSLSKQQNELNEINQKQKTKDNSSKPRKVSYQPRHNDEASVFVGNLAFRTTELKLGRQFEKYGEIKSVRIIEDKETQRNKGFGYVEFEQSKTVDKALEEDGKELDGRQLRVARVEKKQKKSTQIQTIELK